MALLLAIDIGTSSAKAVLFDSDSAKILAVAGEEYPLLHPAPDRAEQNPGDWWLSTVSVTEQCLQQAGRRDVTAIGLTGQMHGVTLLGVNHEVLHPSIIWADSRSAEVTRQIIEQIGAERYAMIAGTLPAAGFMASTLVWLKQHNPQLLAKSHRVILPKDYVRMKLTGEVSTDISDAAATGLFDVTLGTWSDVLIKELELPRTLFPNVLKSFAVAGHVTRQAADALGIKAGIPVVTGCADQPAQQIANGLIRPGIASVTSGTGGQVSVPIKLAAGEPAPTDPRVHVFNHAVPDMHYILGATLSAGLSLRWLRNTLGMENDPEAYPKFSELASHVPAGSEGLLFLPYLVGERTPHMDALARGGFIGLRYHHGRGHLVRAVMEGVAFTLRQTLEISLKVGGIQAETIVASGGAMESSVWRQIYTDIIGKPLKKSLLREQTCIGAALLAGVGANVYASLDEASASVVAFDTPTEPDTEQQAFYDTLYTQFIGLYPRLREDFHQLGTLKKGGHDA